MAGHQAFADVLLASSVNGGGLFLVVDGSVERISPVDTTGVAVQPDGYIWARQAEGVAELRRVLGATVEPVALTHASLDLHDVVHHAGRLYVVATETNTLFELDATTFVEQRRWTLPGEPDAQHLNSVCVHEGRILVSRFGGFAEHRGYKGRTRGAGEVVDIETGEVVVRGLSQPHSLHSIDGRLWLCNSEAHAVHVYRDFVLEHEIAMGGYARGLAFGRDRFYVGISRSRNEAPESAADAAIVALDRDSLAPRGRVAFPANEVYDLVVAGGDPAELRRAGMQDTLLEVDAIRHTRNLVAMQRHEEHARTAGLVAGLQAELQAATAAIAAAEARADRADDDGLQLRDRLAEAAIWAELQARAIVDLQRHAGLVDADRQATQAVLGHAIDALRVIDRSRSWRWTRRLRPYASRRAVDLLPGRAAPGTDAGPRPTAPTLPTRAQVPILGLTFAEHAQPVVSIVVATQGRFAETLACLQSIQRAGDATPFDVILVEAGVPEADMDRFARVPGLRYITDTANLGPLRSVNAAAASARGTYLHLLETGTRVQPGWLDALVATFTLFHACGLAGSKRVGADGILQGAGGLVWSDGGHCDYGRGDDPAAPAHGVVREVDFASAASLLLPTALFAELGGFDARYPEAGHAAIDLAFRIREAGRAVYMQPASVVIHPGQPPRGTDAPARVDVGQAPGRELFRARWHAHLEREQLAPGEHLFLARDRAQLRRIVLVIDRFPPQPDRDAGSRAIWQLMRVLHLHGFTIKFWAQESGSAPGYAAALRQHGIELFDDAGTGPFEDWMQAHGRYIDHVVLSRPMVAERYLDPVRRHGDATVTFYGHDIHHRRIGRHAELDDDAVLRTQAAHLRQVEEALWGAVDLVLYPSDEETAEVQARLRSIGASAVAKTVPLYAFEGASPLAGPAAPVAQDRDLVLFVGGFGHLPNADAVLWFAREVWPMVAGRHPQLRLCLAGGDPPPEVTALAGPSVEVTGRLSEAALGERYRRARVAVAPLRFGAGLKGKVVEAMWHGIPCVTTSTGRQGLADAHALRVADDAVAMADAIGALALDAAAWQDASDAGRAYVADRFTVEAVWEVLSPTFDARPAAVDVRARRERLAGAAHATADG
ncbi:MAG TPA: glycosyltransferase [Luteimonas sp.]|nr:glycosyltransferase [Luteimonas sp.]